MATRRVYTADNVPEPSGQWMNQIERNLTDMSAGFLQGCRFLIYDRSSLFTEQFRKILQSSGKEISETRNCASKSSPSFPDVVSRA